MATDSYFTIAAPATAEFVERRSRFLSEIRPISSEADFAQFLAETRTKHYDARHNCSAFLLRGGSVQRYSDDGEPQGTAGMPILEVLRRECLEDCGVVVTRYFGGILLGAGGLVRAYAHSAKLAVGAAQRVEICRCLTFLLEAPYPLYERLCLLLGECRAAVLDADFGAAVTVQARIRATDYAMFSTQLTELSSGAVEPVAPEEEYAAMPD